MALKKVCKGIVRRIISKFKQLESPHSYKQWISLYDILTAEQKQNIALEINQFSLKPVISILILSNKIANKTVQNTILSISNQLYPHWEVKITDNSSLNGDLEHTTGEFVVRINAGDVLSEHALFHIVKAINANPNLSFIYSDEDKIAENGKRFDPHFKSGWDSDLFYGHNYITNFVVYRRSLVQDVGGYQSQFSGADDYDLALRVYEKIQPEQIHHIPKVLCHCYKSTITSPKAERDAIQAHFQRMNIDAKVVPNPNSPQLHRVIYSLPKKLPLVSIIIPTRDKVSLLKACIKSVLDKTDYSNYEIVIIDNQSVEEETLAYFEELKKHSTIKIVAYDAPFNFSAMHNYAVPQTQGEVLLLLNNDTVIISPHWLSEMVGLGLRPEVGIVGAKLYCANHTIQHAGILCDSIFICRHVYHYAKAKFSGQQGKLNLTQNYIAVTGACLLIRRELYLQAGGFKENLFVEFNDIDLCFNIYDKGYRVLWTPFAELYHYESLSRAHIPHNPEEKRYMQDTWSHIYNSDPYYNPNLCIQDSDLKLSFPPR